MTRLSRDRQQKFLQELRRTRLNVSAAAKRSGLSSPGACYMQRKSDPDFAQEWAQVENEMLDELQEKTFEAATRDSVDRHWVLSRRRPDRWTQKRKTPIEDANQHHDIRDMTDEELMAIVQRGVEEGDLDPKRKELDVSVQEALR